jgi:NCS1 family nucleobase:cation symporter-1
MIAHFVFWTVQFLIMLTPLHKLKYFFYFKTILVPIISVVGTRLLDPARFKEILDHSKLFLKCLWRMVWFEHVRLPCNFADERIQGNRGNQPSRFHPVHEEASWCLLAGASTTSSQPPHGHLWNHRHELRKSRIRRVSLESNGPCSKVGLTLGAIRAFVGFCWIVAQIGTNLSANVISCSNNITNLFPKYINIRRGVIITTVTAGWIMVPWKTISSGSSLLTFMSGLSIFLAPIAVILAADY